MRRNQLAMLVLTLVVIVLTAMVGPRLYREYTSPPATAYVQHDAHGPMQARVYKVALTDTGRALFLEALASLRDGKLKSAQARFDELIALEPHSAGAHEQRGRTLLLQGDRHGAEAAFSNAFALSAGDRYMEKILGRWIKLAREGEYTLRTDRVIEQQFPGQLAYLIEHRAVPISSGLLGASHLLDASHRVTFPTPTALPFDILARAQPGHGTIVFGSSRAREGFMPRTFEAAMPESYAPAVNFAASQSAPGFWAGVLDHLEATLKSTSGKRIKCAIILADPESLADTWQRAFRAPRPLDAEAFGKFLGASRGVFELWPDWTGLTDLGPWAIPDDWEELAKDPYANGLNHAQQGTAYKFSGTGASNTRAFKAVLRRLQDLAEIVVVVATPLSPFQFELASKHSSYAEMASLATRFNVPFILRTPAEWKLDARHFFGAKGYPLDKMDWWHLNYAGASHFSAELAAQVRQATQ